MRIVKFAITIECTEESYQDLLDEATEEGYPQDPVTYLQEALKKDWTIEEDGLFAKEVIVTVFPTDIVT